MTTRSEEATVTIVEFLTARLNEAGAAANACAEVYPAPWEVSDRGWVARVRADEPGFRIVAELEQHPTVEGWLSDRLTHLGLHDPERVLADIAAKRHIIELFDGLDREVEQLTGTPAAPLAEGRRSLADAVLRILALPHADHPDYDEDWQLR